MDISQWRDRLSPEGDADLTRILTDWAFDRLSLLMQILVLQETAQREGWRKLPALGADGVVLPFRYDVSEVEEAESR